MNRGEIRLLRLPPPDKERPVLVLTRQSILPLLGRVTVAPITSTIRGVDSEVTLTEDDGMKAPCVVNLHNVVTVSRSDIGRRLSELPPDRMREVCRALAFAMGCDGA